MAAAVGAATSGAKVTVVEAAEHLGGTTAISGGGLWIPANPWAAAEGVEDSAEDAVRYLRAIQDGQGDPSIPEAYVREALRITGLAEERTPLRWQLLTGFSDYYPELDGGVVNGRSLEMQPVAVAPEVIRLVRPNPYGLPPITINEGELPELPDEAELERRRREGIVVRGHGLVAALAATLLEHGGEIRTGMRATSLLTSGDAVVGVVAGGEELPGQVIVASGGFERDPRLVQSFLRGPMLGPAGPPTNRGDGIRMGMSAAAALSNMSDAWWVPALQIPGETIDGAPFFRMAFVEFSLTGGIVVDGTGRRFVNESVNYYAFGRVLQERDPNTYRRDRIPSWLVFDAGRRRVTPLGPLRASDPDPDWLPKADTIEELSARIGLPGDVLADTVARFNENASQGVDPEFGRGSFLWDRFSSGGELRPVEEPPFYALRLLPGCAGTKGGLEIDEYGRVRRLDGDGFVPGLHAAGNASAYVFGTGAPGPGATIGPAFVFGWRAGETAAAAAS